MKSASRTWFITGASKGVGQKLVHHLLEQGHRVAATSRTAASLTEAFGQASDDFLPLEVDLTSEQSIRQAIEKSVQTFGAIDVVVNNAGYAQQGTVEALSEGELRQNFEVNFFAPVAVLRHALPHLRRQRSGHIINISSIVGYQGGYAGWGSYVSSKFALAGLTESLAAEVLNSAFALRWCIRARSAPTSCRTGRWQWQSGRSTLFGGEGVARPAPGHAARPSGGGPRQAGTADHPGSQCRDTAPASVRRQDRQRPRSSQGQSSRSGSRRVEGLFRSHRLRGLSPGESLRY